MPLESRRLMPDGCEYVVNFIRRHRNVNSVEMFESSYYKAILSIERKGGYPSIKAYIADVYILTFDDVVEVLETYPDIDCIVVISNWNHYTDKAKREAHRQGVGVFTLDEFTEALKYRERGFLGTGCAKKTEDAI